MYNYFAFISFQNADAREAVRLQHAIENYRLPAVLCRQDRSIPRRVKPLFCYLNDMHSGEELMEDLKQRMEQSRFLIVVCSPRSAASPYVNSGIDYFISLGRRDSIIPVIVDGVPYSENPATECFPEALRRHFPKHPDPLQDHSILGVNIREAGVSRRKSYNRAMLMVVARMLELDFDGLLLRDRQRRRRRTILWTLLSLFIAAALGFTWFKAQAVEVKAQVTEATPYNEALPPCEQVVLRLTLDNEQKTDTLQQIGQTAVLRNIPPRYIGREARVEIAAKGYLPLDTTLVLQRELTLSLSRDAALYGHVHFHIVGLAHPERAAVRVGDYPVQADDTGLVKMDIPIDNQRTAYPVIIDNHVDTLYMPCGEDAIIYLPY